MALGTAAADKSGTFADVNSGPSLYFQVKMKKSNEDISHAYPVVGEGMTIYNPKQEEPTPDIFRAGVLGKEMKRVQQ